MFIADLAMMHGDGSSRFITKSSLIPLLALYFYSTKPSSNVYTKLIFTGLFFSWLGDIFLLFDKPVFFIAGLLSFLLTHICYIIYFLKIKGNNKSYLQQRPVMLVVIIAYLVELLYMLWPSLGNMKMPVIIYAVVISTMFATAAWQYEKIKRTTALYFITGSFLFVFSDSVLALGKFLQPLHYGGIIVMMTYIAAQFLIVQGAISYDKSSPLSFQDNTDNK